MEAFASDSHAANKPFCLLRKKLAESILVYEVLLLLKCIHTINVQYVEDSENEKRNKSISHQSHYNISCE